jgi:putative endonuclease
MPDSNYYLYLLFSTKANKYYIGYSTNPWKRLQEYNTSPHNTFTSKYRPWQIQAIFLIGNSKADAIKIERFIKKQKSISLLKNYPTPIQN